MNNTDKAFAKLSKAIESLPAAEFKRYEAVNQPAIFATTDSGLAISLN